ncbi:hypothetical protein EON77_18805 [bacterium]|nr:MAG: hypothetical protein EON77_18805 [bacterium]
MSHDPAAFRTFLLGLVSVGLTAAGWAVLPGGWAYVPGGLFAVLGPWLPNPRAPGRFEAQWRARIARRSGIDLPRVRRAARIDILVSLGISVSVLGFVACAVTLNRSTIVSVLLSTYGFDALGRAFRTGIGAHSIERELGLPKRSAL